MPTDPAPGSLAQKDASTLGNMLCRDYLRGVCYRGDSCKFLHSEQHAPPISNQLPVCRDYQSGTCNRRNCKYAHIYSASGFYDPVTMSAIPYSSSKQNQTYMSTSYGNYYDTYNDSEIIRNGNNGYEEIFKTRATANDPLCKDFQNGYCQRGETCRYRHVSYFTDDSEYPPPSTSSDMLSANRYGANIDHSNAYMYNNALMNDYQSANMYSRNYTALSNSNITGTVTTNDHRYETNTSTKRGPLSTQTYDFAEKIAPKNSNNYTATATTTTAAATTADNNTAYELEILRKENIHLREEIASYKAEIDTLRSELTSLRYSASKNNTATTTQPNYYNSNSGSYYQLSQYHSNHISAATSKAQSNSMYTTNSTTNTSTTAAATSSNNNNSNTTTATNSNNNNMYHSSVSPIHPIATTNTSSTYKLPTVPSYTSSTYTNNYTTIRK